MIRFVVKRNKVLDFLILSILVFTLIYTFISYNYVDDFLLLFGSINFINCLIFSFFKDEKLKLNSILLSTFMVTIHSAFYTGGMYSYLTLNLLLFPLVVGAFGKTKDVICWIIIDLLGLISLFLLQKFSFDLLNESVKSYVYLLSYINLIAFSGFFTFVILSLNKKILQFNRKKNEINNILYSYRSLNTISHDLNNHLMKILAEARIIEKNGIKNSIEKHVNDLNEKLKDNFKDYDHKVKRGNIDDFLNSLKIKWNDEINVIKRDDMDYVINLYVIEKIFDVLINNSKEAKMTKMDIFLFVKNEKLYIKFSDNGNPIKDPKKIFNPFYSSKSIIDHKGMGLSYLKFYLNSLEGSISLKDKENKLFEVVIPLNRISL